MRNCGNEKPLGVSREKRMNRLYRANTEGRGRHEGRIAYRTYYIQATAATSQRIAYGRIRTAWSPVKSLEKSRLRDWH